MKEHLSMDQTVHEGEDPSALASLATGGNQFIIKNPAGSPVAVVTTDGQLYLHGTVTAKMPAPVQPTESGSAFKITSGSASNVVSLIDQGGNLNMSGDLYVEGLPYELREYEDGRWFGNKTPDRYYAS
jgi:hypothetical protein